MANRTRAIVFQLCRTHTYADGCPYAAHRPLDRGRGKRGCSGHSRTQIIAMLGRSAGGIVAQDFISFVSFSSPAVVVLCHCEVALVRAFVCAIWEARLLSFWGKGVCGKAPVFVSGSNPPLRNDASARAPQLFGGDSQCLRSRSLFWRNVVCVFLSVYLPFSSRFVER